MVTPRPGSGERHQIAVLVTNTKYFEVGSSLGWVGGAGMRSWRADGSRRWGVGPVLVLTLAVVTVAVGARWPGRPSVCSECAPGSTGSDRSRTGRPSPGRALLRRARASAGDLAGWRTGHARLAGAGLGGGDGDPPCRHSRRAPAARAGPAEAPVAAGQQGASRWLRWPVSVEVAAFGGNYLVSGRYYVSTDNPRSTATRSGSMRATTGVVSDWLIDEGSVLRTRQVVGRIRSVGGGAGRRGRCSRPGSALWWSTTWSTGPTYRPGPSWPPPTTWPGSTSPPGRLHRDRLGPARRARRHHRRRLPWRRHDRGVDVVQGSTAGEFHPGAGRRRPTRHRPGRCHPVHPGEDHAAGHRGKTLIPGMNNQRPASSCSRWPEERGWGAP